MSPRNILLLAATVIVGTTAQASAVLFSDNFTGTTVDPAKWTTDNPYADAGIVVSNGVVTSLNRGYVTTVDSFKGAVEIDTSIKLTGIRTGANLVWKTDGTHLGGSASPTNGLSLGLYNESQSIVISAFGNTYTQVFHPMPLDTWIDLRVVDTGRTVTAYVAGATTPTITFDYTPPGVAVLSSKGLLEFYSRESAYTPGPVSASMGPITIKTVPDTTSTLAATTLALAVVLVISGRNRVRRRLG